jgi:hypothetical protein
MRVRILSPENADHAIVGTIHSLDQQCILLDVSGRTEPLAVARDQIARLELSAGSGSRWPGALIGAGIGGAAGLAVGSQSTQYREANQGAATIAGVLVGALIGASIPPGERWNELYSSKYRIAFEPTRAAGIGVTVSLKL